jgi:metal-sulfur cluster biosynthetic enzyme
MKKYKDPKIKVNVCYELGDVRRCRTMDKDEAYAIREWVEEQDGICFWFQPIS